MRSREGNIDGVSATVTSLSRERTRGRRPRRATHPPRQAPPIKGRAWINGREVGGANPRFAHLVGSYD